MYKPDFVFRNKGDFQFENVGEAWGISEPMYSNGAVHVEPTVLIKIVNNDAESPPLFKNSGFCRHIRKVNGSIFQLIMSIQFVNTFAGTICMLEQKEKNWR